MPFICLPLSNCGTETQHTSWLPPATHALAAGCCCIGCTAARRGLGGGGLGTLGWLGGSGAAGEAFWVRSAMGTPMPTATPPASSSSTAMIQNHIRFFLLHTSCCTATACCSAAISASTSLASVWL